MEKKKKKGPFENGPSPNFKVFHLTGPPLFEKKNCFEENPTIFGEIYKKKNPRARFRGNKLKNNAIRGPLLNKS